VAALLAALGVVMVLAYQRDLREASQRVSFVNQVTHELKTPLTNIRLYLDLARDTAGSEANTMLDVVEEEASRLSRMIQNVLTFARHERETLSLHPVVGDLAPVVERVVEHWRPLLSRRVLAMRLDSPTQMSAIFDADAVEQILGNLLSNVEKYATPATRVEISLSRREMWAEIRVQDDGPGIATKDAERIFDDFFRSRSDVTEGVSGTGLGLSIARSLAHAQGGTLELVKSSTGACFALRLPLDYTATPISS
jgi:signal transduction histidine kinase